MDNIIECPECGNHIIRSFKLTEIINIFGNVSDKTFSDIKLDVTIDRCEICGSYQFSKELQGSKVL